ncbi:hypothetical protein A3B63_00300 [Candidatus Saccharibacteria bacterium RIFCSPLOWO2_01_FULL_49_22]|nr:MAG: hypothetical protein A3B63_00300 [Candidatus Saccharibacteria bacterium RIFCSPLOWO2_01_FULL_49_22]
MTSFSISFILSLAWGSHDKVKKMRWLRQFIVFSLLALVILSAIPAQLSAQGVNDFKIRSFEADYFLSRDEQKTSILNVIEKITAEFPDIDQNHGILRAIPQTYNDHTVSMTIESIKNESGLAHQYTTYEQNDNLVLKIGDPGVYAHGQQTYVIRYSLRNVVRNFPTHDEFYWDVNGDQWQQVFSSVTARIHVQSALESTLKDGMRCYAGVFSQTGEDRCTIEKLKDGSETVVAVNALDPLQAYETLTFVLAFEPGTFVPGPEIARETFLKRAVFIASAIAVAIPPLSASWFMFKRWRKFGDDPKGRGVIIAEYEPPKNFNTLTSDFLLSQKLRNQAFSAAVVELAIARYINIHEIPKKGLFGKTDYELELVKAPDGLSKEQKKVVETIFSAAEPGAKVKISDIKKSSSLRRTVFEAMKDLEDELSAGMHKQGFFIKDPKKVKRGYVYWGAGVLGIGFAGLFVPFIAPLGIGLLLAGLVMLIFSYFMPARSAAGVEAHDALLGLKDYIKLAEADRLKFGQSPEGAEKIKNGSYDPNSPKMRVKLFESLLPYAMLFGLEKQWGKQFEGIYSSSPGWYDGHVTAFNAAYIGSSLNSFSSASSQTFTSPSSSGGGGFSGGGAGGGGGGGGGGGW